MKGKHSKTPLMNDFCTMFQDFDFGKACRIHDEEYSRGGGSDYRKWADKRLQERIRDWKSFSRTQWYWRSWYWSISWVYYAGVRLFGHDHFNWR